MFQYEISWNSFQAHLASHQSQLFEDKMFADVTLVTDDMTSYKAHKTVLSGASDLFKNLFMLDTSSQPLIFIRGVQNRELEGLLNLSTWANASCMKKTYTNLQRQDLSWALESFKME